MESKKYKIRLEIEVKHENEYMEFYAEPEERIRLKAYLMKDIVDRFNKNIYDVNVKSINFVKGEITNEN